MNNALREWRSPGQQDSNRQALIGVRKQSTPKASGTIHFDWNQQWLYKYGRKRACTSRYFRLKKVYIKKKKCEMLWCVLIFDHEICEGWLYQQHKVNAAGHAFCWKKPDKHNVMTGIYLVRLICLLWFSWVTVREVFPSRNKTMKHNFNETQTENVMNSDSHKVLCSSIVECVVIWMNQFKGLVLGLLPPSYFNVFL